MAVEGQDEAQQPRKKNRGILKKFAMVVAVIVAVFLAIVIVASPAPEVTPTEREEATTEESAVESAAPEQPAAPAGPLAIGEAAQVEDALVTLEGVRQVDESGQVITLAEFRVVNTGDDVYNLSSFLNFEAYGADKRKANPTFSMDALGSLDVQLQPGQELLGEIAFLLPADAMPYTFRFIRASGTDMAEWTVSAEEVH
jgi:Domain of unknown function (DUF4352)